MAATKISDNAFAIFVPWKVETLNAWMEQRLRPNYLKTTSYELASGMKQYSALYDTEPGEGHNLASNLSKACDQIVYYLDTGDHGGDNLSHYLHGKEVKTEYVVDWRFTQQIEVAIPGIAEPPPRKAEDTAALFVEGVELEPLKASLAIFINLNPNIAFHVKPDGILVHLPGGDASVFNRKVRKAFPDKLVYGMKHESDLERFRCIIYKGPEMLDYYFVPPEQGGKNTIDNLRGETEPVKILEAFDIPLELLGY